jgi:hypothetical protein
MMPVNFALEVYRGDSYSWRFALWVDSDRTQPVDLTGVMPKAEIRDRAGGTLMLALPLTVTLPNIIVADLSPADCQKLTRASGTWDMQLTFPDGTVATVVAGKVFVTLSTTDSTG